MNFLTKLSTTNTKIASVLKNLKLIPIYLLQKPIGLDLRFYGLMPLIGLGTLIRHRKIPRSFYLFIGLFLGSAIFALSQNDFLSFRRSIQTMLMAWFCLYLILHFTEEEFLQLAKNSLLLMAIYYPFDFLFGRQYHVFIMQKWHVYNLVGGALDNPNYTGFALAGLAILFAIKNLYKHMGASLFLIVLTQSKTALLCILLSLPFILLSRKNKKLIHRYCYFLFSIIVLNPILLLCFEYFASQKAKLFINLISGTRYTIQMSFLKMFTHHQWGVGYDRAHELFKNFKSLGSSIVVNKSFVSYFDDIGTHNTFLKILVELGWAGYFAFVIFIYIIMRKGLRYDPLITLGFLSLSCGLLLLEGLNEFIFYFFIALILRQENDKYDQPTSA